MKGNREEGWTVTRLGRGVDGREVPTVPGRQYSPQNYYVLPPSRRPPPLSYTFPGLLSSLAHKALTCTSTVDPSVSVRSLSGLATVRPSRGPGPTPKTRRSPVTTSQTSKNSSLRGRPQLFQVKPTTSTTHILPNHLSSSSPLPTSPPLSSPPLDAVFVEPSPL